MNIEAKLYATHYNQIKGNSTEAENVQKTINRVLPQIKIDLQTLLASNTFIEGYTHKL